eukprot:scaffold20352_cov102-Isochrysis_galbana.AAC.1
MAPAPAHLCTNTVVPFVETAPAHVHGLPGASGRSARPPWISSGARVGSAALSEPRGVPSGPEYQSTARGTQPVAQSLKSTPIQLVRYAATNQLPAFLAPRSGPGPLRKRRI